MNLTRKYSDEQRAAVAAAANTPGLTAKRVRELANAGELRSGDGRHLEPFDVPENSVRHYARMARLRPAAGTSAAAPGSGDDVGQLRRRLLKVANAEMAKLEQRSKGNANVTGEELRQMARALTEIHRLQIPLRAVEPREAAPGSGPLGERIMRELDAEPVRAPTIEETPGPPPAEEPEVDSASSARGLQDNFLAAWPQAAAAPPEPAAPPMARTLQSGPLPGQTEEELAASVAHLLGKRDEKPAPNHGRMRGADALFRR